MVGDSKGSVDATCTYSQAGAKGTAEDAIHTEAILEVELISTLSADWALVGGLDATDTIFSRLFTSYTSV